MTLINLKSRKVFDELYTPSEAVEIILPYIPKSFTKIWEPTATHNSSIVEVLEKNNYNVIKSHIDNDQDFLRYNPLNYDIIITNPPYSLKDKFLQRAFELDKPFMFLLPITTLEGKKRGEMFKNKNIQLIIPNKRFNFKKEKKSSAWFQTSWFCYKINLDNQLNFIDIL